MSQKLQLRAKPSRRTPLFFLKTIITGCLLVNRAESGEGESDYRAIYLILAIGQIAILTLFESGSESKSGSLGLANHTYHPPHNRMQAADLNLTLKL